MINLLPPALKKNYRYSTLNTALRAWIFSAFVALLGVGLLGGLGWYSMQREITSSQSQISTIENTLKKEQLAQTNQQILDISNNLKLVERVLSQQILFSKLLRQMATALPDGTYLTGLNISEVSGGSALDITVSAVNYTTATQVQVNLADPTNKLFEKADIQNITCDATNATNPGYPCKISLRAQFAKNNPFLFINQKQVKS